MYLESKLGLKKKKALPKNNKDGDLGNEKKGSFKSAKKSTVLTDKIKTVLFQ